MALETSGPESIIYPLGSCSCLLFRNYLVGCNLKCCRVFHGVRRKHSEIPDYITHTKRCSGYLKWPSLLGLCSPAVTATWKCKRTRHTPTQPLKCITVRQRKRTRESWHMDPFSYTQQVWLRSPPQSRCICCIRCVDRSFLTNKTDRQHAARVIKIMPNKQENQKNSKVMPMWCWASGSRGTTRMGQALWNLNTLASCLQFLNGGYLILEHANKTTVQRRHFRRFLPAVYHLLKGTRIQKITPLLNIFPDPH